MNPISASTRRWSLPVLCFFCLGAAIGFSAHAATKNSSTPAKPAAPAKPASTAAKPAAASTGGKGATTGAAHSTPAANTHSGPTTSSPHGGATANHITTSQPHAQPNRTAAGRVAPQGSRTIATRNGAVTRRANGRISDVHDARRGMDIHHGLDGSRRVEVMRADHSRIVAMRGRPGFIEHRYMFHGRDFASRAYYWHGRPYYRYYRGYYYHGVFVNVYAPGLYYAPAFYGWAYNPWYAPVSYSWGWAVNPWYGYYGFYFAPYPAYAGPADWLTDYVIAADLQASYAAQQDQQAQVAAAAADGQPLLTPDIKAQIAGEVKSQIALENAEAQQNTAGQDIDPAFSSIQRMLSDGQPHVFVAAGPLDVVDSTGAECALSDGDVLQLSSAPVPDSTDAQLTVRASKGGSECQRNASVTVAVADLQEMQNHLRESIDQGLQELQAKQGQGGLPAAPPSTMAAPVNAAFTQAAPPADPNGAAEIDQQLTASDQVDQQAAQDAPEAGADGAVPDQAAPAATVNITLGQSIDDVTAALGQPLMIVNLGPKKIYKYKDMKITFVEGKVANVE
jgi:hypothetical protein